MNRKALRDLFYLLIDDKGINNKLFTEERANTLLYEGALEVQQQLEALNEHYFENIIDIPVTSTALTVALPQNTNRLISLYDKTRNLQFQRLPLSQFPQFAIYYESMAERPHFNLRGSNIVFPVPYGNDFTLTIVYTVNLNDITGDTQSWNEIPPFAQRNIAYEAANIAITTERGMDNPMKTMILEKRQALQNMAEQRVRTQSRSVIYVPN